LSVHAPTLAEAIGARVLPRSGLARDALLIGGGALFTALLAQVSVRLPFTPVPITLQTLAVLLVGASLGARRGFLAEALYVLLGLAGLPVYAGGQGGLAHLLGPTGGYIIGFVLAAYLAGRLAERSWDRQAPKALLAMILADLLIYACGLPWLALYVGWGRVLLLGFVPFIVGDTLKILIASGLLPGTWRLLGSR
jgi:biotin transport system substrate-specific component